MHIGSIEDHTAISLDQLIFMASEMGASDIHLKHGLRPRFRVSGDLIEKDDTLKMQTNSGGQPRPGELSEDIASVLLGTAARLPIVDDADLKRLLKAIDNQMEQVLKTKGSYCASTQLGYEAERTIRLRMHYTRSGGRMGVVMRLIPVDIPDPLTLNIPQKVRDFINYRTGLVLICGLQGQGKSTTLASLVEEMNKSFYRHIVTIEDPVEFVHSPKKCSITQREIGQDSPSFTQALEDVHRQDANVVVVGEVRSEQEMEIVLTLAEAGLLVFATVHSKGAGEAIERAVNMFSNPAKAQYRMASVINGVACQQLMKKDNDEGRILATEILMGTPALRNLIRSGDFKSFENQLTSATKDGNISMSASLDQLRQRHIIA